MIGIGSGIAVASRLGDILRVPLGGRPGTHVVLLPYARRVRHHQLFLAEMPAPRDLVGQARRQRRAAGPPDPLSPAVGRPVVTWIQPPLFDPGPRDYRRRVDLRTRPTLDNPCLAAAAPHIGVAVALAAVHAARHGDIITMQLSDVDLANQRLTVAGHTRPLDDLTHAALTDWLDYRRCR
ncbi:hypothetical protein ABZ783_25030 [Micromonospora sp. NPDC047738]|uniref:hypothetical protein n=1 Tax=Micromonospora sp. NPDC047738 TaxID=3155741 RepID=UPI0033EACCF9